MSAEVPPAERERRRRAALLLGDLLPESSSDDVDLPTAGGSVAADRSRDEELRRDVPPHHGD